jgi:hypothetical protein
MKLCREIVAIFEQAEQPEIEYACNEPATLWYVYTDYPEFPVEARCEMHNIKEWTGCKSISYEEAQVWEILNS